jgi:hypothetical protein
VELALLESAGCDGSRQAEQEKQSVVQGLQGQDFACAAHEQQASSVCCSSSSSSSSRDGFSAVTASHAAKQVVAVAAADSWPQAVDCSSSSNSSKNSNNSGCSGSSPTANTHSVLSSRHSYSSIVVSTEASNSSCDPEQQQQQPSVELAVHASAGCDVSTQTEPEQQCTQSVLQWAGKLFKRLTWGSDADATSSSSSNDECSAAAASYPVTQAVAVPKADIRLRVASCCSNTSGSSRAETRLLSSAHATDTGALIAWQRQAVAAMVLSSSSSHLWGLLCTQPMDVMAAGRQSRRSRLWCSGQQSSSNAWPAAAKLALPAAATATAV